MTKNQFAPRAERDFLLVLTLFLHPCFGLSAANAWQEIQRIAPTDAPGVSSVYFGWDSAISGNTAVVGAWGDSAPYIGLGSVFVFQPDNQGTWNQIAQLRPDDQVPGDNFGAEIDIDGERVIVGASGQSTWEEGPGAAYIFGRDDSGAWSQVARLNADVPKPGDGFGLSVSVSGNTALVGAMEINDSGNRAGAVYIFREDAAGDWNRIAKLVGIPSTTAAFGNSVALSGDTAIVGSPRFNYIAPLDGTASIFQEDALGNWNQIAKFSAGGPSPDPSFGRSVSISGDHAIALRDLRNSIYVFGSDASETWSQVGLLQPSSGESFLPGVAISDQTIVSSTWTNEEEPLVYFFGIDESATWNTVSRIPLADATEYFEFGKSAAIDGRTAIVGAMLGADTGRAFLFRIPEPNTSALVVISIVGFAFIARRRESACSLAR